MSSFCKVMAGNMEITENGGEARGGLMMRRHGERGLCSGEGSAISKSFLSFGLGGGGEGGWRGRREAVLLAEVLDGDSEDEREKEGGDEEDPRRG